MPDQMLADLWDIAATRRFKLKASETINEVGVNAPPLPKHSFDNRPA